ncbi:MAG TPA: GAF and ANTAR domain-containing protein [Pseudonocardiaceae bacterium]|nr:GAF and ANTAR domain-containing protein [Pseudonocardiaceae bacterium]
MTTDGDRNTRILAWVTDHARHSGTPVSLAMLCETAVGRLAVSGVTLLADTSSAWPELRHATDMLGARLAELQVTVGEGPFLDVWREGGPILVPDLTAPVIQRRWPLFGPLAVEAGAGALFAIPIVVGAVRVGVLALHRVRPGHMDAPALLDALAFAELALRLPMGAPDGHDGTAGVDLELRTPQVHQATGMIAAQLDVTMAEAFSRLRARAFADQRSLADLATDLVARRLRLDPNEPT